MKADIFLIRIIIFASSFFFSTSIFSQEASSSVFFQITNNGSVGDIQPYKDAIAKANWNCYRLMTKRRTLNFDSGVIVELFSVDELSAKGNKVDTSCLTDEKNISSEQPLYHLSESGIIIEMHTNQADKNFQKEQGGK